MVTILCSEIYLLCILILSLIFYWSSFTDTTSASDRWFSFVLSNFICSFMCGFMFEMFNGWLLLNSDNLLIPYIFKSLYFLFITFAVFSWCGYTEVVLGHNLFHPLTIRRILPLLIPMLVPIALIAANFHTHILFLITEDHMFIPGNLFRFLMLYLAVSTLIANARIIPAYKYETDPIRIIQLRDLLTFPVCLIAIFLLSFSGLGIPVICVCVTGELLYLYLSAANRQILIDNLTQVNNRRNLYGYLQAKLDMQTESLYLMILDLDHFKNINDTYGHLEGDAALVRTASALKQACQICSRRPYISRYGGDEFIIVAEQTEKEILALCSEINERLDSLNTDAGVPYTLHLSIGYIPWKNKMTPREFIAAADKKLYEVKKARKERQE